MQMKQASRSQRIMWTTFWLNNLVIATWVVLIVGHGEATTQAPWSLVVASGCLLGVGGLLWRLIFRLKCRGFHGWWFTDDERERTIAAKINRACLTTLSNGVWGLLLILGLHWVAAGDAQRVVIWGIILVVGLLLGTNCQYAYLWRKYTREA